MAISNPLSLAICCSLHMSVALTKRLINIINTAIMAIPPTISLVVIFPTILATWHISNIDTDMAISNPLSLAICCSLHVIVALTKYFMNIINTTIIPTPPAISLIVMFPTILATTHINSIADDMAISNPLSLAICCSLPIFVTFISATIKSV